MFQFELLLAAASKRDHESPRISVQTHLRITESIESDMLSHDRHASIKLYTVLHSPRFDYGVRRFASCALEQGEWRLVVSQLTLAREAGKSGRLGGVFRRPKCRAVRLYLAGRKTG